MLLTERQKKIPYGIEAHCGFGAPQSTQSVKDINTLAMASLIADGVGRTRSKSEVDALLLPRSSRFMSASNSALKLGSDMMVLA
jgi:hypothetical protein